MIKQILKKIGFIVVSVWVVITASFFLVHILPGSPFLEDVMIPEEVLQALTIKHKLQDPFWIRYCIFIKNIISGDFGVSFIYNERKVFQIIFQAFPVSATFGFIAIALALLSGTFAGCVCATKNGLVRALGLQYFSFIICLPSFLISIFLQYCFCIYIPLFPLSYRHDIYSTILPILCLSIPPSAVVFKLIYTSVAHILRQDFIVTAKAKGLSDFKIITSHVLKNASLTTFSYVIPIFSSLLTGSFIVEKIFAIPGIGNLLISSVQNRDFPLIYALVMILSLIFITLATVSDFANQIFNPQKS